MENSPRKKKQKEKKHEYKLLHFCRNQLTIQMTFCHLILTNVMTLVTENKTDMSSDCSWRRRECFTQLEHLVRASSSFLFLMESIYLIHFKFSVCFPLVIYKFFILSLSIYSHTKPLGVMCVNLLISGT